MLRQVEHFMTMSGMIQELSRRQPKK